MCKVRSRFGTLVMVDDANRAFRTLAEARDYARSLAPHEASS
jgi:hypothetical protein